MTLQRYKKLLDLNKESIFIKIEHEEAMVAAVYKVLEPKTVPKILKICPSALDYANEIYCLQSFAGQIAVPRLLYRVPPCPEFHGALLMEYVPGNLLTPSTLTKEIAFDMGRSLARIHSQRTASFGYLTGNQNLNSNPREPFKAKFEEGLEECRGHLPEKTIQKVRKYFDQSLHLLEHVDGPCVVHRDFRPGNIIVSQNKLAGIIDWSSARSSFAQEDLCFMDEGVGSDSMGYKNIFLAGYQSLRALPPYGALMPLLRLNKAIAILGLTVKKGTWSNIHAIVYNVHRSYVDGFDFKKKDQS